MVYSYAADHNPGSDAFSKLGVVVRFLSSIENPQDPVQKSVLLFRGG